MTWFVIEADITATEPPRDPRLAFFTVLLVRERVRTPSREDALALIDDYLEEAHAPFGRDVELIAIAVL